MRVHGSSAGAAGPIVKAAPEFFRAVLGWCNCAARGPGRLRRARSRLLRPHPWAGLCAARRAALCLADFVYAHSRGGLHPGKNAGSPPWRKRLRAGDSWTARLFALFTADPFPLELRLLYLGEESFTGIFWELAVTFRVWWGILLAWAIVC